MKKTVSNFTYMFVCVCVSCGLTFVTRLSLVMLLILICLYLCRVKCGISFFYFEDYTCSAFIIFMEPNSYCRPGLVWWL